MTTGECPVLSKSLEARLDKVDIPSLVDRAIDRRLDQIGLPSKIESGIERAIEGFGSVAVRTIERRLDKLDLTGVFDSRMEKAICAVGSSVGKRAASVSEAKEEIPVPPTCQHCSVTGHMSHHCKIRISKFNFGLSNMVERVVKTVFAKRKF